MHPHEQNTTILETYVPHCTMQTYISMARMASLNEKASEKPSHGVAWGAIQPDGWSLHIHLLFCQDNSHVGGVKQRRHIANPHLFDSDDHELCAYMHPMRVNGKLSAPHQRYACFLMNGYKSSERSLLNSSSLAPMNFTHSLPQETSIGWQYGRTQRCRLAINIQSDPAQIEQRSALRATWVKVAKLVGLDVLRIYFVVGNPKEPLAPHLQAEFDKEVATMPDMLKLDFTECYHCVWVRDMV